MKSAALELSLWEALKALREVFEHTINDIDGKYSDITELNLNDFKNEVLILANFHNFFDTIQKGSVFQCRTKVPQGTCLHGISTLTMGVFRSICSLLNNKVNEVFTNKDMTDTIISLQERKFIDMDHLDEVLETIESQHGTSFMTGLRYIPCYKHLIDNYDSNLEAFKASQDFQSFGYSAFVAPIESIETAKTVLTDQDRGQYSGNIENEVKQSSSTPKDTTNQADMVNILSMMMKQMQTQTNSQITHMSELFTTAIRDVSKNVSSNSNHSCDEKLIQTLVDSNISTNLHKYDLAPELKFDGTSKKLVYFVRHLVTKVFPDVKRDQDRLVVLQRNVTTDMLKLIDSFMQSHLDSQNAIFEFLNYLISQYGDRNALSLQTVTDFLASINFDHNNKIECENFKNDLMIFNSLMNFLGTSTYINNCWFLKDFLAKIPRFVNYKWDQHVSKHDLHIRRIFSVKDNCSLFYNVQPEVADHLKKHQKPTDSIDVFIKCPPEVGSTKHHVQFVFKTFIDWFENFYIKGGMASGSAVNKEVCLHSSQGNMYSETNSIEDANVSYFQKSKNFQNKGGGYFGKHGSNQRSKQFSHYKSSNKNDSKNNQEASFLVLRPELRSKLKINATQNWFQNKCSIWEDQQGKFWKPWERTLFLKMHNGCNKCGFNHPTKMCSKSVIRGFPCDTCDSHVSAKFHNTKLHSNNWYDIRRKYLVRKKTDKPNIPEKSVLAFDSTECVTSDDFFYDDYHGSYFNDPDQPCYEDNDCKFDSDEQPEIEENLQLEDTDILNSEIFMCTDAAYSSVPNVLGTYRTVCYVIISDMQRNFEVPTLLLFDTGSDTSFIDDQIRTMIHIDGPTRKIQMGGINCKNERRMKICSCLLINPETGASFKLENIGSIQAKDREFVPKHTLPDQKTVQSTPGLETLDWPKYPECHILLGMDYVQLFTGSREKMTNPMTIIEQTPIGTKIGGMLGSKEFIRDRKSYLEGLKSKDIRMASVGNCTNLSFDPSIYDLEDQFVPANPNEMEYLFEKEFSEKEKIFFDCSTAYVVPDDFEHDENLLDNDIGFDDLDHKKLDNDSTYHKESFMKKNCNPNIKYTTPTNMPSFSDKVECLTAGLNFLKSGLNLKKSRSGKLSCDLKDPRLRRRKKKNLMTNNALIDQSVETEQLVNIPNASEINPALRNAQVFEMPEWQRVLADNVSKDLLDCIVQKPHPRYDDLLYHSYLDKKGWSIEQRHTFQECIKKAYKDKEGRYVIPLVFNKKIEKLSNSKHLAKHFIASCEKKAKKDPDYGQKCMDYLAEMSDNNILEDIPEDELDNPNCHYLAWFEVVTGTGENGKGKFRIVFNAAAKINGISLNDCLTSAPELTASILSAAYKFRERKFVLLSDIKKMFFQFCIPPEQRDFLRILVHEDFDLSKPIKPMRFTRIAFGLKPASMMASLGVQLCARDNISNAPPSVTRALLSNLMMDDWVYTSDTSEDASNAGLQTIALGKTCKLDFVKFDSNSFDVLKRIPKELWTKEAGPTPIPIEFKPPIIDNDAIFSSEQKTKLLGTIWNKQSDTLSLRVTVKPVKTVTKRNSLSQQNSIYDNYGMAAAVTLVPKILIQKMHQSGVSWDDKLPSELSQSWIKWMTELPLLSDISIKRAIIKKQGSLYTDLHIYSDSSNYAEGFVSFFRTVYVDEIDVVFAMARSCVIPIKTLANVQRLELDAILFAVEKIQKVIDSLSFQIRKIFFWTDSQYCLRIITDTSKKLSVFEFNRISKINMLASDYIWCHIPGVLNPADAYSRGISPRQLLERKELLEGPANLKNENPLLIPDISKAKSFNQNISEIPEVKIQASTPPCFPSRSEDCFLESSNLPCTVLVENFERTNFTSLLIALDDYYHPENSCDFLNVNCNLLNRIDCKVSTAENVTLPASIHSECDSDIIDLLDPDFRSQSWEQYIQSVANVLKMSKNISNLKKKLSVVEFTEKCLILAKDLILGVAQRMIWKDLLPGLQNKPSFRCPKALIPDYKFLTQCSAFLDHDSGLIKCYGRYASVTGDYISDRSMLKIVLPDRNEIVKKLILSVHEELQHAGFSYVSGVLSRDFWIIRSSQFVRNVLTKCINCKTQRAMCKKPEMSTLPAIRLKSFVVPFTNAGIDCAGPIKIKYQGGRNVVRKSWVLVITCLSTRAVDFALLKDMCTDTFLTALDTFNYRHNCPLKSLWCDRGSNFMGGANVLSLEEKENIRMLDVWIEEFQDKDQIRNYLLTKNIKFNFGKSATPHQQGYVEVIVGIFKTMLYRVVGPFSKFKETSEISQTDFELILVKLAYAINQRPLTSISDQPNDLDYISPASFLKIPLQEHDHYTINNFREFYSKSRDICNKYLKEMWTVWETLYLPSLYSRQKWLKPLKPLRIGDLILYRPTTKLSKIFYIGRITELIPSSDSVVRHVIIKTSEDNLLTVPVHNVTFLEGDNHFSND